LQKLHPAGQAIYRGFNRIWHQIGEILAIPDASTGKGGKFIVKKSKKYVKFIAKKSKMLYELLKKNLEETDNFLAYENVIEMDKLVLDKYICGMDAECRKWRELPEYGAKVYSKMEAIFLKNNKKFKIN
jgi:hypothetical protein